MSAHDKWRDFSSGEQIGHHPPPASAPDIKIGKATVAQEANGGSVLAEVFTMSMASETIELLPFKNWIQLDLHKWKARGWLPRTPAGLEITSNHVKVADQTVSPWDPGACAKLEKAFNEWLAMERNALDLAKNKAQAPLPQPARSQSVEEAVHFEVHIDSLGQARLKCLEGTETVKVVALNQQGLNALIEQGLMRKPNTLKVGALHDWVELDGELFRFKEGDGATLLQEVLNKRYIMAAELAASQDVFVFSNPASPTGFDIQFPAIPNALVENRKRHLNEETVQLLQDPERCRVLRKGITARLTPPDLVFKRKTPEGGEGNFERGPESIVSVVGADGQTKTIDLSQPVSLLNLGVSELTAVFNHQAINRRARLAEIGRSQDHQH